MVTIAREAETDDWKGEGLDLPLRRFEVHARNATAAQSSCRIFAQLPVRSSSGARHTNVQRRNHATRL